MHYFWPATGCILIHNLSTLLHLHEISGRITCGFWIVGLFWDECCNDKRQSNRLQDTLLLVSEAESSSVFSLFLGGPLSETPAGGSIEKVAGSNHGAID